MTSWLCTEDAAAMSSLATVCAERLSQVLQRSAQALNAGPSGVGLSGSALPEFGEFRPQLLLALTLASAGEAKPLEELLVQLGARFGQAGLSLAEYWEIADVPREQLTLAILEACAAEPARAAATLRALQRIFERVGTALAQEQIDTKERLLSAQRKQTEQALLRFSRLFESGILG